jgi:hypothetical protein
MLMSPVGLRSEEGCDGNALQKLKTTDPSSRQRGRLTSTNPQPSKNNLREKGKKLVTGPRWVPDIRTDWPTDWRSKYNCDFDFDSSHLKMSAAEQRANITFCVSLHKSIECLMERVVKATIKKAQVNYWRKMASRNISKSSTNVGKNLSLRWRTTKKN